MSEAAARMSRDWLPGAKALQRRGMTLSEIAELLNVSRAAVVQALYWEVVK